MVDVCMESKTALSRPLDSARRVSRRLEGLRGVLFHAVSAMDEDDGEVMEGGFWGDDRGSFVPEYAAAADCFSRCLAMS